LLLGKKKKEETKRYHHLLTYIRVPKQEIHSQNLSKRFSKYKKTQDTQTPILKK
jgi:hypothetical protein